MEQNVISAKNKENVVDSANTELQDAPKTDSLFVDLEDCVIINGKRKFSPEETYKVLCKDGEYRIPKQWGRYFIELSTEEQVKVFERLATMPYEAANDIVNEYIRVRERYNKVLFSTVEDVARHFNPTFDFGIDWFEKNWYTDNEGDLENRHAKRNLVIFGIIAGIIGGFWLLCKISDYISYNYSWW